MIEGKKERGLNVGGKKGTFTKRWKAGPPTNVASLWALPQCRGSRSLTGGKGEGKEII